MDDANRQLRQRIYAAFVEGKVPTVQDLSTVLDRPPSDVREALAQLSTERAVVLQRDGEILMAEPFSAVPTPFLVRSGPKSWWGNCIWDGLGIAAMLRVDAELLTSCQCCGARLAIEIERGERIRTGS